MRRRRNMKRRRRKRMTLDWTKACYYLIVC
jgi:hypothetical protein